MFSLLEPLIRSRLSFSSRDNKAGVRGQSSNSQLLLPACQENVPTDAICQQYKPRPVALEMKNSSRLCHQPTWPKAQRRWSRIKHTPARREVARAGWVQIWCERSPFGKRVSCLQGCMSSQARIACITTMSVLHVGLASSSGTATRFEGLKAAASAGPPLGGHALAPGISQLGLPGALAGKPRK